MEAIGLDNQPEALTVRCAKAALFLSRLKFPRNCSVDSSSTAFTGKHQEREMELSRKVEDLRRKLVRERSRSRRVKLCGMVEFLLQMVLLLSLWTLCLMLALKFL